MNALVLCGGKSSRMGWNKSLINYWGLPHREFIVDLLKPFCEKIFLSFSDAGQIHSCEPYSIIIDKQEFAGVGPIGALLSAWKDYPNCKSWILMGCDYPFADAAGINLLLQNRQAGWTAFYNIESHLFEPLFAIYESNFIPIIFEHFKNGNYSLSRIINHESRPPLIPPNPLTLMNVNKKEDYLLAQQIIQKQFPDESFLSTGGKNI